MAPGDGKKTGNTRGLRHTIALARAGSSCRAAHSCDFLQQQLYDPGRTRACNLWFRRPTPYPLGHRTSWNTWSRPLQVQVPPSPAGQNWPSVTLQSLERGPVSFAIYFKKSLVICLAYFMSFSGVLALCCPFFVSFSLLSFLLCGFLFLLRS